MTCRLDHQRSQRSPDPFKPRLGFLPVKKGKRRKALEAAIESPKTAVFFESPHRLISTLEILTEINPMLPVCVARELSKKFETYHRDSAENLLQYFQSHTPKGEIVLLLDPSAV